MHAFPASFDFKGEALSSISDLSLLEIVTKTHGMPYGYRKVLKLFYFTIARRSSLPRVSLHERQQEIIKTVHDEPLMPGGRMTPLEGLFIHPWMSSHQCDQSSTPSTGDSVFSDVSKLQAQGECTSTRDGESKEVIVCDVFYNQPVPRKQMYSKIEFVLLIARKLHAFSTTIKNILSCNPQITNTDTQFQSRVNVPFSYSCVDGKFIGHQFGVQVKTNYAQFITYPLRPDQNLVTVANEFNLPQKLLEDYNP
ncbi:hypothetical protein R3W88_002876 [Solanum pinnatisectum]|uniref:LYK3/RLK10-like LysM domain-containing protein n=1 Tax=Solanum pinnatisectum TaxID=50273 RepID=A0AAV9MMD2_9SOLN|nr:hypothetical protein R3W88_002876 [Solanum pinnatisectum]